MTPNPAATISVIITCYNHCQYLRNAIESVRVQEYVHREIVVVDDGSTDCTKSVATSYDDVKYVWQTNQGLAAARNTGIRSASGNYLIFLDADDWLYPGALQSQMSCLEQHSGSIAVAGGHNKVNAKGEIIEEDENLPRHDDHYVDLLQGNFIGMHAAVMYRRSAFNELEYDINLRAAEDYDLFLRLTRHHPICVHQKKIAAYRIHENNMSSNIPLMLQHVLQVLMMQKGKLNGPEENKALKTGVQNWKEYYTDALIKNKLSALSKGIYLKRALTSGELAILKANYPTAIPKILLLNMKNGFKKVAKKLLAGKPTNNKAGEGDPFIPVGKINWGSFMRTKPISKDFGFDRGGPVDRYYIEKFLLSNEDLIKGTVLEIGDNSYTRTFGRDNVLLSEVLHVSPGYPGASYSGDLSRADEIPIPSDRFDCIILTQTLHFIYDYNRAIQQCHRMLKPGGTLLLTVPGVSQIDAGEGQDFWLWSFSRRAMLRIMNENFPSAAIGVNTHGNVFSAAAFLWGAGIAEIPRKELLDTHDPGYQVIITVRAVKEPIKPTHSIASVQ